ncbi:MAG: serine/threonine protein kinase [Candidatus Eremiobacteraeota bacterium]|nr:serine/threonine protein kinase [Candidatus Eremiobacteraeota bacterium]
MNNLEKLLTNRYRIKKSLGCGAFSEVYLAEDIESKEERAIKVMDLDRLPDKEKGFHYDLFLRESQMLQDLDHPGIPIFFDFFIEGNLMILVMEYVKGIDLDKYMEKHGGPLEELETLSIFIQVCQILEFLHMEKPGGKIIYRDLKPSNIIIDENSKIKLIDFATARIYSPEKKCDTIKLGTPGYAAPEAYGSIQTDERADVYSAGASMFHALTGEDPEKYMFHFPSLRKINPRLSVYIDGIVQETLKPREERTRDITTLKDRLNNLKDTLSFMKKFSPASIFFRGMFSIIQLFRMKFSFRPSRDFVKIGFILLSICIITPLLVTFLFIKFPPYHSKPFFKVIHPVPAELRGRRQQQKLARILENEFDNFKLYCDLKKYDKAMSAWRELISFVSIHDEVMKKKLSYYPSAMKIILRNGNTGQISEVFLNILGEYERYMNGSIIGDPGDEIQDITGMTAKVVSGENMVNIMRIFMLETPNINYSRKIFVIHRVSDEMARMGKKKEAIEILSFLVAHIREMDNTENGGIPIPKNLNVKQMTNIDMLFIRGEISRYKGNKNKSREYYKQYLEEVGKRKDPDMETYRETFREKLFIDDARRNIGK